MNNLSSKIKKFPYVWHEWSVDSDRISENMVVWSNLSCNEYAFADIQYSGEARILTFLCNPDPRSWIPGAAAPHYWQSALCLENQILAVHHICIWSINQYLRYNRNIYNIPCSLHNNYNKCEYLISLSIFKQNPFHRMVNRRLMRKCDFINWIPIRSFDSTFLSFNIFTLFNFTK